MTGPVATTPPRGSEAPAAARLGFWIAIAVSVLTVVSFGLAMTALPDRVPYPFTDPVIAEQWPGDYLWLFPAMVLMLAFVALAAAVHLWAPVSRKVFSLVALCFATLAAAVLLGDYFVQARARPHL
jgi:Na+-driven multidrug efflux pump